MQDELNLDKDWRIGENSFAALVSTLEPIAPRVIVEFGSGASSVRLAMRFPDADIHSVDHDPDYAEQTRALQQAHGVRNLTVHLRPLRWQIHGGGLYRSYAPGELPAEIDAAIIDGPPYFVHLGREACFYQIVDKLRVGGAVVLDDCNRRVEQKAVEAWVAAFPGNFQRKDFAVGHGLCVLTRTAKSHPALSWRALFGNYRAAASRLRSALFSRGTRP